ncbi:MAG: hypothetical protein IT379_24095, partial [Deltaproteobacteria bacterium]|nr:hypothetical protein [Deltaproteobacteria bacterium]
MELTIAVYQRRVSGDLEWTTLGLAPHDVVRRSLSPVKLEQAIVEAVRTALERVAPADLARFEMTRGTTLVRARLELTLGVGGARRRVSSMFPIVVEPRRTAGGHVSFVGYHPAQQDAWWCFEKEQEGDLPRIASAKLSAAWAAMDPDDVATLTTDGKDGLRAIRFSIRPRSLLDELPDGPAGVWDDLRAGPFGAQRGERPPPPDVLRHVGTDLTLRALDGAVPLGMPRKELRERLAQLLGAKRAREPRRSILLVGPPSAGKTSLVHRWVADALEADDYPTHRNL